MSLLDNNYKYEINNISSNNKIFVNYFTNMKDKYDDTYFIHLWNQFWNRNNIDKNSDFQENSIMYDLKNKYI